MDKQSVTGPSGLGWLAFLASTGTLICCALPILLVTLGFGSVVAALTSRYPLLVTLSDYEGWMFGLSAGLLALTAWFIWGRQTRCPADPVLAARCQRARSRNQWILSGAVIIWSIGFTARFLLLPLRNLLGI
ncbi:MAG: hypothetical protein ABFS22_11990 [Pseudomonadota bacterium]